MDPENCKSEFTSLEPMRPRRESVKLNVADFLAQERFIDDKSHLEMIERIGGTDLPEMDTSLASTSMITNEMNYNEILDRFTRNEIAYDDFMQLTGGIGLDEEIADFKFTNEEDEIANQHIRKRSKRMRVNETSSVALMEDEEDWDDQDDDEIDHGKSEIFENWQQIDSIEIPTHSKILPEDKSTDDIDEDRLLGIPLELRTCNQSADQEIVKEPRSSSGLQRSKLSKTLDAVLGQANVIYAKGQVKEALTMLLEVIRQAPRTYEPYLQVADIYNELGQPHNSLQYGLLAAHLNYRTPPEQWCRLGDLAFKLERFEEAAACYGRATRGEPTNWKHYEKRIDALERIGLRPLAMKTRLQAAQFIDHSAAGVDFEWFSALIKTAAEYYIQKNDEEKAISALEAYVLRSRVFGRNADTQHNILIGMWMTRNRFEDAAKSIFALCPDITALNKDGNFAIEVKYVNATYTISPFPPTEVDRFIIGDTFSTSLLARLITCFIRLGRKDLVPTLIDKLLERTPCSRDDSFYVDIGCAYQAMDCIPHAQKYVEHLLNRDHFRNVPGVWFIYGQLLTARKKLKDACIAFMHVIDLQPSHVDARINLSTIQQRLGMTEQAFETLKDYDLDTGSFLPDERLLIRQADFLFKQKRIEQFVKCVRMLLAPHFYVVYKELPIRRRWMTLGVGKPGTFSCNGLRRTSLNAVRGSQLEKYVKRLGSLAVAEQRPLNDMTDVQMHDYSVKLIETLLNENRFIEALQVCCYTFLHPAINKSYQTFETFQCLLLYCSFKAKSWNLAFEHMRWLYTSSMSNDRLISSADRDLLFVRIFNAMNYIFCHSQNVSYHRYIMRSLSKIPGNIALQMISGNNSLVTGAYRHALGEYLRVWFQVPDNPLVCLLIALTFSHMACKKDIASRHMILLRAYAFMSRYEKLRGIPQESYYNIARMFHQINFLHVAMYFYEKCLETEVVRMAVVNNETYEDEVVVANCYDLRPLAAHNLALIYEKSGNTAMARYIKRKYITV